jgi:hypothetical protein
MVNVHTWTPSSAHTVRHLDTNEALKTDTKIRFAAKGVSVSLFRDGKFSVVFLKDGNKMSDVSNN